MSVFGIAGRSGKSEMATIERNKSIETNIHLLLVGCSIKFTRVVSTCELVNYVIAKITCNQKDRYNFRKLQVND